MLTWNCPSCGGKKPTIKVWPFHCRCGAIVQQDGTYARGDRRDDAKPPRPIEEQERLVRICVECPHKAYVGELLYCGHPTCKRCGGASDRRESTVAGVGVNLAMDNKLKAGTCPVRKWAAVSSFFRTPDTGDPEKTGQ